MHVPLVSDSPAAPREKRERKPAKIPPGTIVAAKVTNMHATHAGVELESGAHILSILLAYTNLHRFELQKIQHKALPIYLCLVELLADCLICS